VSRHLLLSVLLSALFLSCGGPGVVIQYQGSSPVPPVNSNTTTAESQKESDSSQTSSIVTVLSIPSLEGGNRALQKRINYPEQAIQNGIEGTVSIQFNIDEEGNTSDFTTIEGIGYGCEEAVIQAIKESQFKAGRIDNQSNGRFTWLVTTEFKL